jgi:MOSC domain-containing protein YiiM
MARVLSVNLARDATLPMRGYQVRTGIFKEAAAGAVRIERLGLEGDFQVDKRFHGGPDKAVYIYPQEHYAPWQQELGLTEPLPYGAFGENLTIEGLLESDVRTGERFRIGTAVVEVTKPRMPCMKLALKFRRPDMVKRMHANERSGFYVSVVEEGTVEAGDSMERLMERPDRPTIPDVFRMKREA